MRKENQHQITAKRVNKKRASFLDQQAASNKKDSQTEERSPEIFPTTRLLSSFQTVQTRACIQNSHSFLDIIPKQTLPMKDNVYHCSKDCTAKIDHFKNLPHKLHVKGQWINKCSLVSAADRQRGIRYLFRKRITWALKFWIIYKGRGSIPSDFP